MAAPTVAVLGLGAYGAATAYQLARRGARVVGFDQFAPPHAFGSSTGETRITRFAVLEGEEYVGAAMRSAEIFSGLGEHRGERLFLKNGFSLIADDTAAGAVVHGEAAVLARTVALARKFGISHETYDGADFARKFPGFTPAKGETAYHEPGSGTLFPEGCIAAQLDEAEKLGATLHRDTRVLGLDPTSSGVRIRTAHTVLDADHVVVAAGAWVTRFLPDAFRKHFRVTRQVLFWFEHAEPSGFSTATHPNYIWPHADADGAGTYFYGFPCQQGGNAIKIATEMDGLVADPDQLSAPASEAEIAWMFETHAKGRISGLTGRIVKTATCRYTGTPKSKSLIAAHPETPRITIVSSCSGHGFKLSAAMGESIAQSILNEPTPHVDLAKFGWNTLPA